MKKWIEDKNSEEDFKEAKPDEKGHVTDYHIRAKGLTTDCVKAKAEEFGITVLELYERLFNGDRIEFDLCAAGGVKFEKKNFTYITKDTFKRAIQFGLKASTVKEE